MQAKKLLEADCKKLEFDLEPCDLSPGVHFINVKLGKDQIIKKLIIKP